MLADSSELFELRDDIEEFSMTVAALEAFLWKFSASAGRGDKVSWVIEGVDRLRLRVYRDVCIG